MMIDGTNAILEANPGKGKLDLVGISDELSRTPNRHDCELRQEDDPINRTEPKESKPVP